MSGNAASEKQALGGGEEHTEWTGTRRATGATFPKRQVKGPLTLKGKQEMKAGVVRGISSGRGIRRLFLWNVLSWG